MRNTQSPEHREREVRIIEELRKNPDLSNRSIAALCGAAHGTVGRIRFREGLRSDKRLGLDGKRYRVRAFNAKGYIEPAKRWDVWERDDFRCQSCGSRRFLQVDHINPQSRGGTDETANLQTLCEPCNRIKGTTFRPQVEKSST